VNEKMTEAEVSIRLALHLSRADLVRGDIRVAIDGAQVRTADAIHFRIREFLDTEGCKGESLDGWQGRYEIAGSEAHLVIHSNPGEGDVVADLRSGSRLHVESKKGPLVRSRSSVEYPLVREAIGQLMTLEEVGSGDVLGVAVPRSPKFSELARRWRAAPLIQRLGLLILLVGRDGGVDGLTLGDDAVPAEANSR